ncbi:MAG: hypothetical protein AMXMBFR26_14940 [Porticoccaceae bacterium]
MQTIGLLTRFGIAGAINTSMAYLVFALLVFLGIHYTVATFLGGIAGLVVGYYTTGGFVFRYRGETRWLRFISVFIVIYLLNISVQKLLRPHLDPYLSGACGALVSMLMSFMLNRSFVFRSAEQPTGYGETYASIQIRRSRNPLRRLVRAYYLRDIVRYVEGPAIDVGCGAGDLLALLPVGSLGLEVNPAAVAYGQSIGLNVELYDPEADRYRFDMIPRGRYRTILFTHVLEHLDEPGRALKTVFESASRTGIRRIVITVPCQRGFRFDSTHRTYVDETYLRQQGLLCRQDFVPVVMCWFPINWRWLGSLYTYHELRVVFERNDSQFAVAQSQTFSRI